MSERKQTATVAANKLAMSKALGAAFLNHQVEQLEKSVSGINDSPAGNWRSRRNARVTTPAPPAGARRPPLASGAKAAIRPHHEVSQAIEKGNSKDQGPRLLVPVSYDSVRGRRRSDDGDRDGDKETGKDADIIVVDASVLVHALYKVKRWCRDGRDEIIIVPLEALNTLDLLKKGTSPLAQRARMASRILEAQVGTNPRIRVQQDDAFVLWDKIEFRDAIDSTEQNSAAKPPNPHPHASPEWVRRTICCARWEIEHAAEETKGSEKKSASESDSTDNSASVPPFKVLLAVLAPNVTSDMSSALSNMKLSSSPVPNVAPVPLPAPHANKHEPRSSGALVAHWAARAQIEMLPVDPAAPPEDDAGGRAKRSSRSRRPSDGGAGGKAYHNHGHTHSTGLVERPPAVKAMMDMVAQPSKVVRVLARGEKLDPDT